MRYQSVFNRLRIVTLLPMLILASCSSPSENNGGDSIVDSSVDCQDLYRAASGEVLSETPTMSLSTDGDLELVQFENIEFRAKFLDDEFEGQSLSISITNMENQRALSLSLYQIDQEKGLANQFIGGHGFTGLIYVFHPSSEAELQYFCEVR